MTDAADQRSGGDTETGDAAPDPDDRAAAVGRERRGEQGQPQGHHDRGAEALDGTEADQDAEIGASAHAAEARLNSSSPATYVRLRPRRSPSAAAVMMPAAKVRA